MFIDDQAVTEVTIVEPDAESHDLGSTEVITISDEDEDQEVDGRPSLRRPPAGTSGHIQVTGVQMSNDNGDATQVMSMQMVMLSNCPIGQIKHPQRFNGSQFQIYQSHESILKAFALRRRT